MFFVVPLVLKKANISLSEGGMSALSSSERCDSLLFESLLLKFLTTESMLFERLLLPSSWPLEVCGDEERFASIPNWSTDCFMSPNSF